MIFSKIQTYGRKIGDRRAPNGKIPKCIDDGVTVPTCFNCFPYQLKLSLLLGKHLAMSQHIHVGMRYRRLPLFAYPLLDTQLDDANLEVVAPMDLQICKVRCKNCCNGAIGGPFLQLWPFSSITAYKCDYTFYKWVISTYNW